MPKSQQPEDGISIILEEILKMPDANVIDVGAGEGKWGKLLKGKVKQIDGVEVWEPYIKKYGLIQYYDNLFNINMMDIDYDKMKYEIMILGDVLEHLKYNDAITFMTTAQKYIDNIFLIIPISLCVQNGSYYGNPYESHLYQWKDEELTSLFGFKLLHTGFNPNGLVKIGTYIWKK